MPRTKLQPTNNPPPSPPAPAVDNRPASRLSGWDADIDHMINNALVDADGTILWLIRSHIKGSITGPNGTHVDINSGQRIVEVIGEITPEHRRMYRNRIAAVDSDGAIVLVSGAALGRYREVKSREVDERTSVAIRQGAVYSGVTFSLSPNAIAKYTTARMYADELSYPYTFSSIDNSDGVTIADANNMKIFTGDMLGAYLIRLNQGDSAKVGIRGAQSASDIDTASKG